MIADRAVEKVTVIPLSVGLAPRKPKVERSRRKNASRPVLSGDVSPLTRFSLAVVEEVRQGGEEFSELAEGGSYEGEVLGEHNRMITVDDWLVLCTEVLELAVLVLVKYATGESNLRLLLDQIQAMVDNTGFNKIPQKQQSTIVCALENVRDRVNDILIENRKRDRNMLMYTPYGDAQ